VGITLWAGFGLGADYVEYRDTQDFDSFVADFPVSAAELNTWLPSGTLLLANRSPVANRMETLTNCREDSYDIAINLKGAVGNGTWSGETENWHLENTWNGEVW
jgi:hypothetical protein